MGAACAAAACAVAAAPHAAAASPLAAGDATHATVGRVDAGGRSSAEMLEVLLRTKFLPRVLKEARTAAAQRPTATRAQAAASRPPGNGPTAVAPPPHGASGSSSGAGPAGPRVPRRILQTLNRKADLPAAIGQAVQAWQALNPEYEHELHDGDDMRALIGRHFDRTFLDMFDALGQYQQRSDLWRLCALFVSGGVYADADYAPLAPLRAFLPPEAELVLPLCVPVVVDPMQPPPGCHSRPEALRRLQNGFIAVAPQHPVVLLALQKARWNYYRRENQHYLMALGPALLYEAYAALFGDPLGTVLSGRDSGVLLVEDAAPLAAAEGARHGGRVHFLVDTESFILSLAPGEDALVPRLLHKYPGWAEGIASLRDDNTTRVSARGVCLRGFR